MTQETIHNRQPQPLTEELIKEQTGFELQAVYPGFANEEHITPSVPDDYGSMCERFGYENVMPSFYQDEDGTIQLGLFAKLPQD